MAKRPNVLWLMSDQHNTQSTGYSGNPKYLPVLDSIQKSKARMAIKQRAKSAIKTLEKVQKDSGK